ncbi:hypothetical protein CMUS01_01362 [Colletotrichum musicola]|uniref:Uncharacterized protein n=1 Tax=Colletotrichum musicola TaxID=2175873 RepID=A0A8H6NX34_9PEZI|nr:hypothetical protein CMUS01_01362 [Colletotrichum musicola]
MKSAAMTACGPTLPRETRYGVTGEIFPPQALGPAPAAWTALAPIRIKAASRRHDANAWEAALRPWAKGWIPWANFHTPSRG